MSDTQASVWTYPPSAEEREQLAAQLQERDRLQAANDRVPSFDHGGDIARGAPRKVTMRSDRVDVDIPPPVAPTFYAKHSTTPRSGASVGPDDIVELNVPGLGRFKTSVANALREGLIAPAPNGGYRGLDAGERNDQEAARQLQRQQEQAEKLAEVGADRASGDAPDADTAHLMAAVAQTIPSQTVQQLAYDLATNGTVSEANVVRAAEAAGMSGEQGRQVFMRAYEGLSRQAAAAVASEGVPVAMAEECYAWAAKHMPVEYKSAVIGVALGSDVGALKQIARQFYLHQVLRQSGS